MFLDLGEMVSLGLGPNILQQVVFRFQTAQIGLRRLCGIITRWPRWVDMLDVVWSKCAEYHIIMGRSVHQLDRW